LFDRVFFTIPMPPTTIKNKKTFLFASGELNMAVTVPKTNLYVGEILPIKVVVENSSTKRVDRVKVQLQQRCIFRAQGHQNCHKYSHNDWKTVYENPVDAKLTGYFDLMYAVPPVLPTLSSDSAAWKVQIVHIYYRLVVRLDVSMAIDPKVKVPVNVMLVNPRLPPLYIIVPPAMSAPLSPSAPPLNSITPPPQQFFAPQQQQQFFAQNNANEHELQPLWYPVIDGYEYPKDLSASQPLLGEYTVPDSELE